MYSLKMYIDTLEPMAKMDIIISQHCFCYIYSGCAIINGQTVSAGNTVYAENSVAIQSCDKETCIWRYEVERTEKTPNLGKGTGVKSEIKMIHRVRMFELAPTAKYLFRVDRITKGTGCAGWHCNTGSGIRTMLTGGMTVESKLGENSVNRGLGATWYEEGSYPVYDTYMDFEVGSFIRFMVFPVEFAVTGNQSTDPLSQGITWISGRASTGYWEILKEKVLTLI